MTRQEAARLLEYHLKNEPTYIGLDDALRMAIAALSEVGSTTAQLDENGLMPCGCGGMTNQEKEALLKRIYSLPTEWADGGGSYGKGGPVGSEDAAMLWPEDVIDAISQFAEDNNAPAKQPDPITGLVPCGCGGKARIKHDGPYSSKCIVKNADETFRYEGATVLYPGHTHAWVDCDNNKCECSVGYCGGLIFKTDEEARDAWNRAMGWREDK